MFVVFGDSVCIYRKKDQKLLAVHENPTKNTELYFDKNEIINILKPYKNRKMIFIFQGKEIVLREIVLPTTKTKEIEQILHNQIQEFLPLKKEDYHIGFAVSGGKVVVGALPKHIASYYIGIAESLAIQVVAMDIGFEYKQGLIIHRTFNIGEKLIQQFRFPSYKKHIVPRWPGGLKKYMEPFLVLLLFFLLAFHFTLKIQISKVEDRVKAIHTQEISYVSMENYKKAVYQNALTESIEGQLLLDLLKMPAFDIEITSFSIAGVQNEITVSGHCLNRLSIFNWAMQIEEMEMVNKVGYSYRQLEKNSWDFIIYIHM